jgi:hypothetical protein
VSVFSSASLEPTLTLVNCGVREAGGQNITVEVEDWLNLLAQEKVVSSLRVKGS